MKRISAAVAATLVLLWFYACSGGGGTSNAAGARLASISVTPSNPSIAQGTSQQFIATGMYSDNTTGDITSQVIWNSSNTSAATINSSGLAGGSGVGTATITASMGAVSGSTTLSVTSATLVSIAVTPTDPSIPANLTQQFTATGTYSDNTTQDITAQVTWSSSDTSVATITGGGKATTTSPGTTTISASLGGFTANTTLTVNTATLVSITLAPGYPSVAKGLTQQFTATGTYSDDSNHTMTVDVMWSSSDEAVATVSNANGSKGLATANVEGSTTITATDPATNISGSTILTVTSATLVSIAVTPTNSSAAKGLTKQFTATGTYTDGSTSDLTESVTWNSSNTAVATISNVSGSKGQATASGAGSTTITATYPTTTISGSTTLTVTTAKLVSLAVTPATFSSKQGLTKQFTATGTYTDSSTNDLTTAVTWSSSDTSVATISNAGSFSSPKGLATLVSEGSATITATYPTTTISGTATLSVVALMSLTVTPTNPGVPQDVTKWFIATGVYADSTTQNITSQVTWTSSNTSVATISTGGKATPISSGTTTITATLGSIRDSTTLTVTPATLQSIAVTPANPSIPKSLTEGFTATGTYSDSTTYDITTLVAWSSSNTSVATISTGGKATPVSSITTTATTTITATRGSVSNSTTLTVTTATLQSIAVTPANPSIPNNLTKVLTATGTYSDGSTHDITTLVTWSSSNTSVATMSNATGLKGQATSVGAGSTTITATDPATNIIGSTALIVTSATLASIAVTPANPPGVSNGMTKGFTATGTYSDSTTQNITSLVTWSSSTTSVATISNASGSKGQATAVGVGTTNITATDPGTGKTGSTTLTVL